MQRIKKLLLAACLFWAGASQVARADQNVNYIYKEKGQLVVHLGTIPDRFQSVSVPIWSEQNGQDDLIWYPVQRGENGFDLQVPLTNHLDQAGLYHIHVYGIHSNGNIEGLFPLQTIVEKKTWHLPNPRLPSDLALHSYLRSNSSFLKMWRRSSFPSGLNKMAKTT